MISDFTDHAANERTYLAWVRTALAFMAFGLLLERSDLLLRSLPGSPEVAYDSIFPGIARIAGLMLILLGVLVLGISSYRYLQFKRLISAPETRDFRASSTDLMLVVIVALIGGSMGIYVAAQAFL